MEDNRLQERREMKQQRKDQTEEQRIMRDMGALLLSYMPEGGDKSFELKKLWRICPHGYSNFISFYNATVRLTLKSSNS